jgi:hypothetical protein
MLSCPVRTNACSTSGRTLLPTTASGSLRRMQHPGLAFVALVFAASCVVGPMLDQIHVVSGALAYADPWLLGQAWWVAPQFGIAFALVAACSLLLARRPDARREVPASAVLVGQQVAWLRGAYLATGALWREPLLLAALLLGALAVRYVADRPDAMTIRITLLLALAGTAWEALLSSQPGTFDYAPTDIDTPAPIWLPLLYAHGAPLVRTLFDHLARRVAAVDG